METTERNKLYQDMYNDGTVKRMVNTVSSYLRYKYPKPTIFSVISGMLLDAIIRFEGDKEKILDHMWRLIKFSSKRRSSIRMAILKIEGVVESSTDRQLKSVPYGSAMDLEHLLKPSRTPTLWIELSTSPKYEILVDKYLHNKTNSDIATERGISRQTVDGMVKKALAALKKDIIKGNITLGE